MTGSRNAAGLQVVTGPGQGDTRWRARDRDMDRHAMQSEGGYLVGCGREWEKGEEQKERNRREGEKWGRKEWVWLLS